MATPSASAAKLRQRFPAILHCRSSVAPAAAPAADAAYEAELDILLPQHQIILHRAGRDAQSALEAAFAEGERRLLELARRDRDLADRFRPSRRGRKAPAA